MTEESDQFVISSTDLLLAHCNKLQGYSSGIKAAVGNSSPPVGFNAGHVLKEMSKTALDCKTAIEHFGDDDPIPWALLAVVAKTQIAIVGAADALAVLVEAGNAAQ